MATVQQSAIESHREGAEVFHGAELCRQKSMELLEELHLPRGLLPLPSPEEVGYNRSTGFVWLKQPEATEHYFKKIKKKVSYAAEVTAFVEDRRMKRMTGAKSKELVIWISLSEMYIDDPASGKITFRTPTGLSRSYPVSAFEEEVVAPAPAPEEEEDKNADGDK